MFTFNLHFLHQFSIHFKIVCKSFSFSAKITMLSAKANIDIISSAIFMPNLNLLILSIDHLRTIQIVLGIRNPPDAHHLLYQTKLLYNY